MRPILYEQDETLFRTNGIGVLHDAEECKVTEVRNGKFELEMVYPLQGEWMTEILQNRYILARPNDYDKPHAFRIYDTAVDLAANHVTVKAVSITDDLAGNLVKPFSASFSITPNGAWSIVTAAVVDPIRYRFWSDISAAYDFGNPEATNILSLINGEDNSMVKTYGGEVKRENDTIYLFRRRGRDHVTTIRPRKNLKNIKITTNMSGKFTRILPYAKYTPEGENQQEQTIYGDIITSDHYDDYYVKRIVPIDVSQKLNDYKQQQKAARKEQLKADRENNRRIDSERRAADEARREQLEVDREAQREQAYEDRKAKRAAARVTAQEKRAAAKAAREANKGIKKTKAQRAAEAEARYQAREEAYNAREAEREAKYQQKEAERKAKRAASKQDRINKKNAREAERASRKARQDEIKENTKIVITKEMVTAEAANYFDENPTVDVPNIKIEVDMIPLQDTTQWERSMLRSLEQIKLCDTVDVYVKKIDTDVTVTVTEIEYDVLREKIIKIVATSDGKDASSLADAQRAEWKDHTKKEINNSLFEIDNSLNKILTSANGKNQNFYGPDEPPADMAKENDMWFKEVAEGEIDMYRFDGTQWVLLMPHDFGEQLETKINDMKAEIKEALDQYEEKEDDLRDEVEAISSDALAAVDEFVSEFDEEISAAKTKLDEVAKSFETAKAELGNKLAELAQKQTDDKVALIQQTQRDIQQLQDGIIERYSNLRVGTNNLLTNTIQMGSPEYYSSLNAGWVKTSETYRLYSKNLAIWKLVKQGASLKYSPLSNAKTVSLQPNTAYTMSFYAKANSPAKVNYTSYGMPSDTKTHSEGYNGGWTLTNEWKRYWVKFITGPRGISTFEFQLIGLGDAYTKGVMTSAWQLEESHILSDWHPSDSDLEENIAEYKRTIDQNLSRLQTTVGTVGDKVTSIQSTINQAVGKVEAQVSEITALKEKVTQAESKIEAVPGQITAQVSTAKEEVLTGAKNYTNAQIQVAEGSIAQRITANLTGQVEGIISSSITQDTGKIRQAIVSAKNDAIGTARQNAQTIVETTVSGIRTSIQQVERNIPKKYGGRNYLQGTDKTRYSGSYALDSSRNATIIGYNTVNNKSLRDLGIPSGTKLTLQFNVKFKTAVRNAKVSAQLYTIEGTKLQDITNVTGYDAVDGKNITGTDVKFRIGYVTPTDNTWQKANQVRFIVSDTNNVEFEVTQCILYSGDMVVDWVSAIEDTFVENGGANLLRNGNFVYGLTGTNKTSTQFWEVTTPRYYWIWNYDHGFNTFKKNGIIRGYGQPDKNYGLPSLIQSVTNINLSKGDVLTASGDFMFGSLTPDDYIIFELQYIRDNVVVSTLSQAIKKSDASVYGMVANQKSMRRLGATFETPENCDRVDFKLIFPHWRGSGNNDVYFTRLQLEQSKVINDFKENPLDIDVTTNAKFQSIEQTLDMYKRTIGETENGVATKVAQMVMKNDSFQTTISNASGASNNLILDTETFEGAKANFNSGENSKYRDAFPGVYGKTEYVLRVPKYSSNPGTSIVSLPLSISQVIKGEKYTVSFKVKLTRDHDTVGRSFYDIYLNGISESYNIDGTAAPIWSVNATEPRTGSNNPFTDWVTVKKTITINVTKKTSDMPGLLPFRISIEGSGELKIKEIMMVRGDLIGEYAPASGVSSTIVKQLSNSWAVKNLNNAGDIVSQINVNSAGVRIKGKYIDIDGDTHITRGVIDEAAIKDGSISNAKIAYGTIESAKIANLDAAKIVGNKASLIDLEAVTGRIQTIFTDGLVIGNETTVQMNNGALEIMHYRTNYSYWPPRKELSNSDDVMLRINGRISGGTRFNNAGSIYTSYVPAMTNHSKDTPLYSPHSSYADGKNPYIGIYGVRWMGIVTFAGHKNVTTNENGYLYLDDGSSAGSGNHLWYCPLFKDETQRNTENDFYPRAEPGTGYPYYTYYRVLDSIKTGWK